MKRPLAVILCFGLFCSQVLAHELPGCLRSNDARLPSRFNAQSRANLSIFVDPPGKALMSDSNTFEVNNTELNRIRKQRLVSGLGLAVSWAGTVFVDLLRYDGYRSTTLIPVVGPWITLARMGSNHDPGWPGAKALLVLSGIAQTGFATYFIISLTRHPRPKETKAVALSAGFNAVSLRIQF
jgi:hypothetical protein